MAIKLFKSLIFCNLVVVAGVTLLPLLPEWPMRSSSEVFEGSSSHEHPPSIGPYRSSG